MAMRRFRRAGEGAPRRRGREGFQGDGERPKDRLRQLCRAHARARQGRCVAGGASRPPRPLDARPSSHTRRHHEGGAGFRSLADAWAGTRIPQGRFMLTVIGGLAEFERESMRAHRTATQADLARRFNVSRNMVSRLQLVG